jgi:hypothetical protein
VKSVIEKEKENHALVLLIEGGDRVLEWDPESMIIFKEIIRGQKPTINLNDYVLSQYCESSCWTSSLYLRPQTVLCRIEQASPRRWITN